MARNEQKPPYNEVCEDLGGTFHVRMGGNRPGYASDYDDLQSNLARKNLVAELYERCYPDGALATFERMHPSPPEDYDTLAKAVILAIGRYHKEPKIAGEGQ